MHDPRKAWDVESTLEIPPRPIPPPGGEKHLGPLSTLSNRLSIYLQVLLLMIMPAGLFFGYFAVVPLAPPLPFLNAENLIFLLPTLFIDGLSVVAQYETLFHTMFTFSLRFLGLATIYIPSGWITWTICIGVGAFPHYAELIAAGALAVGSFMSAYILLPADKRSQNIIRYTFLRYTTGSVLASGFFFVCIIFQFAFSVVNELWAQILLTLGLIIIAGGSSKTIDMVIFSNSMKFANRFFIDFVCSLFQNMVLPDVSSPYVFMALALLDWFMVYLAIGIPILQSKYSKKDSTPASQRILLSEQELADLQEKEELTSKEGKDTVLTLLPPPRASRTLSKNPSRAAPSPRFASDSAQVAPDAPPTPDLQGRVDEEKETVPFLSQGQTESEMRAEIMQSPDFTYGFKDDEWLVEYGSKTEEGQLELDVKEFTFSVLSKVCSASTFIIGSTLARYGVNSQYLPQYSNQPVTAYEVSIIFSAMGIVWAVANTLFIGFVFNRWHPNFPTRRVVEDYLDRHFFSLLSMMLGALCFIIFFTLTHFGVASTIANWRFALTGSL